METLDEWLVAVHILCAIIWIGGVVHDPALRDLRAQAGAIPLGPFAKQTEFVGLRTFLPASLILLGTGIWLVSRDVFTLDEWVVWGLIVIGDLDRHRRRLPGAGVRPDRAAGRRAR